MVGMKNVGVSKMVNKELRKKNNLSHLNGQ